MPPVRATRSAPIGTVQCMVAIRSIGWAHVWTRSERTGRSTGPSGNGTNRRTPEEAFGDAWRSSHEHSVGSSVPGCARYDGEQERGGIRRAGFPRRSGATTRSPPELRPAFGGFGLPTQTSRRVRLEHVRPTLKHPMARARSAATRPAGSRSVAQHASGCLQVRATQPRRSSPCHPSGRKQPIRGRRRGCLKGTRTVRRTAPSRRTAACGRVPQREPDVP